jgi:hypothetical protein
MRQSVPCSRWLALAVVVLLALAGFRPHPAVVAAPLAGGPLVETAQARPAAANVRRSRQVIVSLDGMPTPADLASVGRASRTPVRLDLFEDVSVVADFDHFDENPRGTTWVGHVRGVPQSTVTLVYGDGRMTGTVVTPDAVYAIGPAPDPSAAFSAGRHVVSELDQGGFRPEGRPLEVDLPSTSRVAARDVRPQDAAEVIDLMVIYTPGAEAWADPRPPELRDASAILDRISLGVSETNTSYMNSGVQQRLRLVHVEQVLHDEIPDSEDTLGQFQAGTGAFAGVAALRDLHAADLVMLVQYSSSSVCGLAYLMSVPAPEFESMAFSVVEADCISPNFTFAHELGHNMGLRHDWFVDSDATPFSYAHGHVHTGAPGDRWRSLMSYNDLCASLGFGCTRLLSWSNADLLYNGAPMGVPAGTKASCTTGSADANTCDADTRLALNETAPVVASFRVSQPGPFTKATPAGDLVTQPDAVTITWSASSRASSYEYCHDMTDNGACDTSWTSTGTVRGATLLTPAWGAPLYWQVRAVNADGVTAADGGAWHTFQTGPAAGADFGGNGNFTDGAAHWRTYATPDMSHIVSNVTGGVLQFYRVPPPAGSANQAVVFQNTGIPLGALAPIRARFELGNSDTVRKRVSVLLHDSDFSDLSVCTFWLPAGSPLRPYEMRTHTTRAWANATVSFYAAVTGSAGGFYRVDNVSVAYEPSLPATETTCVDPFAAASGGLDGPDLLTNGDFAAGVLTPWGVFGTITHQITDGAFEFMRPTSAAPAGVLLQATGHAMAAGTALVSTFDLGNSSAVRKRVTVVLHDNDFSDLSACTFWLPAGQPLSPYTMRGYATQAWTNATLSVYAATIGADEWMRLDNVDLRTTSAAAAGTECLETGASLDAPLPMSSDVSATRSTWTAGAGLIGTRWSDDDTMPRVASTDDGTDAIDRWIADGFEPFGDGWTAAADPIPPHTLTRAAPLDLTGASAPSLTFESWLTGPDVRGRVEVSLDGVTWLTAHLVEPSDTWMPVEVALAAWSGDRLHVRLVLESSGGGGIGWRIGNISSGAGSAP